MTDINQKAAAKAFFAYWANRGYERFTGDNFRHETAKRKMESMKKLITD